MPAAARPLPPVLDDHQLGLEARSADDDHLAVRTWLRLLACSTQIEQAIRGLLRREFGTTLARFDYLAQLERHPDGLRMSALSRYLMVTGGNVTGLTTQLEADGHVERLPDPEDGRSWRVRLTPAGRRHFTAMARVHEGWLRDLFDGVPAGELQQLYGLLGHLRHTVADHVGGDVSERPVTTAPSAPAPHTAHTARTARTAPMAPAAPARAARTKRTAASTRSRRAPAQPSKPAARRVR